MSTSKVNYCPQALDIAALVETSEYIEDPNIAADMAVVRNICTSLETGISIQDLLDTPTLEPTITPEVTPTP